MDIESRDRRAAGDAILHPLALVAIAVLILNDHVLKGAHPGLITGKLSDVTGLIFFPLLLLGSWEVALLATRRWRGPQARSTLAAVVLAGLGFAAVKTNESAASAFGSAVGLAQWLVGIGPAVLGASPIGQPGSAGTLVDPGDLLALPALLVPLAIGLRRTRARG